MSKISTTGRRFLEGDVWHDDNGPIQGAPDQWDPPMTDDEIIAAANSDPDNPPLTDEQLSRMRRVSIARRVRQKLGLSREEFAARYHIPLPTLRDWELHRADPDPSAEAYLQVIEREPEIVQKALAPAAE